MAAMALNQLAGLEPAVTVMVARWTTETLGPTQVKQCLPAGVFGAEFLQELGQTHAFLELNHVSGHVVTPCLSDGYDATRWPSQ